MESPAGGAMQALLGELGHDHEFIKTLHVRVLAPRKALMLEILRRGVERGDVRPDAVKPVIAEAGPALLVHRLLMYGPPIDPAYVDSILDDVVMPLISPRAKRRLVAPDHDERAVVASVRRDPVDQMLRTIAKSLCHKAFCLTDQLVDADGNLTF